MNMGNVLMVLFLSIGTVSYTMEYDKDSEYKDTAAKIQKSIRFLDKKKKEAQKHPNSIKNHIQYKLNGNVSQAEFLDNKINNKQKELNAVVHAAIATQMIIGQERALRVIEYNLDDVANRLEETLTHYEKPIGYEPHHN